MLDDAFDFWDVSDEVYNAIRMAELAAEGAAVRASARAALLHRVALALLGASLLLGLAMLLLPALQPWSRQAGWVLVLGVAGYLAIAAIAYWTRPTPSAPELRQVRRIRHGIAALLDERRASRGASQDTVLTGALADAIAHLDEQVIPALQQLVERRARLDRELARYERRELRAPAPEALERLQRIRARLQAAIEECVQQAANAYATLVALLQEGDDGTIARRAREWTDDLRRLYDALAEVLRGEDDPAHVEQPPVEVDAGAEPAEGEASADPEPTAATPDATVTEVEQGAPTPAASGARPADSVFIKQVEEALRRVRDLGRLSDCKLMDRLPWTVAEALRDRRNGQRGTPTSLERARALQDVLIAAVERLKPEDDQVGGQTDHLSHYSALHLEYIVGLQPQRVAERFFISPRTFFRCREDAIEVLARDLRQKEEGLRRPRVDGPGQ